MSWFGGGGEGFPGCRGEVLTRHVLGSAEGPCVGTGSSGGCRVLRDG